MVRATQKRKLTAKQRALAVEALIRRDGKVDAEWAVNETDIYNSIDDAADAIEAYDYYNMVKKTQGIGIYRIIEGKLPLEVHAELDRRRDIDL